MNVSTTALPGVLVIEPRLFKDSRGFFLETYHLDRYREAGLSAPFVQDNHSRSWKNVLRGLHLQLDFPQGKLVRAVTGRIWDVAVDVTPASPTFKQWFGIELTDENNRQMFIPPGYAHGFVVLSDVADVSYKCTELYHPEDEVGILWNDVDLGVKWPVTNPIVSQRDAQNLSLDQFLRRLKA
jgi:dTDP-4-dehydrorhamnose 3,5-epimerase